MTNARFSNSGRPFGESAKGRTVGVGGSWKLTEPRCQRSRGRTNTDRPPDQQRMAQAPPRRATLRQADGPQQRQADELAAEMSAPDVIFQSNARCNQENVIKQLKNGVQAMRMPAGDLVANWAYMAIATLAFNIKAWLGLLLPRRAGGAQLLTMDFIHALILIPTQIKTGGRRLTRETCRRPADGSNVPQPRLTDVLSRASRAAPALRPRAPAPRGECLRTSNSPRGTRTRKRGHGSPAMGTRRSTAASRPSGRRW